RRQWDEDARSRYFAEVTDERVQAKVFQTLDSVVGSTIETYLTTKAAEQRRQQASTHILSTLDSVIQSGAPEDQQVAALQEEISFFQASPSYQLTDKQVEENILTMADKGDRQQAALVAKAYMEDERISPESRLFLRAKYAEATAATEI